MGQALDIDGTPIQRVATSNDIGSTGITEIGSNSQQAASAMAPALAAVIDMTNWVMGFSVDGLGATAGSVIEITLTGVVGGTRRWKLTIPAGVGVAIARFVNEFSRPLPATAPNVAITLNVPSFGAGNTSAVSELHGFQR